MKTIQPTPCTGGNPLRTTKCCLWVLLVALLLSFAGRTQAAVLFQITNQFELDGNIAAQLPNPPDDWLLLYNGGANNGGSPALFTGILTAEPVQSAQDDGFNTGSKIGQQMMDWTWILGQVNDKTDLDNVAIAQYTRQFDPGTGADTGPATNIFFMADVSGNNGDATISLWLFRNKLSKTTNAAGDGGGFTNNNGGLHSDGDILLESQFVNGGGVADVQAFAWSNSVPGNNKLVAIPIDGIERFGIVNSNTITPPWPYLAAGGGSDYLATTFFEGGAALSAFGAGFDPCFSSFLFATRNSQSQGSSMSDFALGSFATLPGITPTNATVCSNNIATLCANVSGGIPPFKYVWTGPNGFTSTNTGTSSCIQATNAGNYLLTVTGNNGCSAGPVTNTLTVTPGAPCSVGGPSPVCPRSTNTYNGPAGLGGYAWSITGNGTIVGPANAASVQVAAGSTCNATYTLILTATAGTGCSTTCSNTFTVNDTVPPVLVGVPSNTTVECLSNAVIATVTATDGCDAAPTVSRTSITNAAGCPGWITNIWIATDLCGNKSTNSQVITIQDITAPVLVGVPTDTAVQCITNAVIATVTATDNCDPAPTVARTSITNNATCPGWITNIWVATDRCQNKSTNRQVITINDTSAPIIAGVPGPSSVQCITNAVIPTGVTASDNCDPSPTLTLTSITNNASCPGWITNTWVATDRCSNKSTNTQVITINDTTAPVLAGVPGNTSVQCITNAVIATGITASDNCDPSPTISRTSITNNASCPGWITNIWVATDRCNNKATNTQVITINDTTAPVIAGAPGNTSVQCITNAVIVPAGAGGVTATDNCDPNPTVTLTSITNVVTCPGWITNIYVATDRCSNKSTNTQVITITDSTPPVLVGVPGNTAVQCITNAVITPPGGGGVTATDNCDSNPTVTLTSITNNAACPGWITNIYVATDRCSNKSTNTQVITINDTTAPVLVGVPSNTSVQCITNASIATVTATDNCDPAPTVSRTSITNNAACPGWITNIWVATDRCQNKSTNTQVITINDTTAPVLVGAPGNTSVQCITNAVITPAGAGGVTATDNCDPNPTVALTSITNNAACPGWITNIYVATDRCSNKSTNTQVITINDTTAPVLANVPGNTSVQCITNAVITPAGAGGVTATDNCDPNPTVTLTSITNNAACPGWITNIYVATDRCSNKSTNTQVITINDTTAPVLVGAPGNTSVQCITNAVITPAGAGGVTATDNCDPNPTVTRTSITNNAACPGWITNIYVATDRCSNKSTNTQVITISDTQAPVLANVPGNTSVQCITNAVIATGVTASDNCDPAPTVSRTSITNNTGCPGWITNIWVATDRCSNKSTNTQVITISDTTAPVLVNVPGNTSVQCLSNAVIAGDITATDNCDPAPTVNRTTITNNTGCPGWITNIWVATDRCSNKSTNRQVITISDTLPPVITCRSNFTVACNAYTNALFSPPTAVDNCVGTNVTILVTTNDLVGTNANGEVTHTRSWKVTDGCTNSAECSTTITVEKCPTEFCSLTQGFYGNAKGKYNGTNGLVLLNNLLGLVDQQLGAPGLIVGKTNRAYLVISNTQASCIVRHLPAGGPSSELPAGKHVMLGGDSCTTDLPLDNKGIKFRNNLLGQQITLSLNIRLDSNLGGFVLSPTICTVGGEKADVTSRSIDPSVLSALATLGLPNNVRGLVELGNRALAGDPNLGGASLGSIQSAIGSINEVFDECRFAVTCPVLQ